MGVKGLTTFMDENLASMLMHHKLHDTKVIIDGNNFAHCLYHELNISCVYGGDYHSFSKKLKTIFGAFLACRIRPYIVFDGGYEVDNRKLDTVKKRFKDRIHMVSSLPITGRGKFLPLLAIQTLIHVLDEFKIPHCTCTFEADDQIAVLANEWNCPVISNDSDFFVFNLSAGFLPLDYLNYQPVFIKNTEKSYYVLPCMLYTMENFLSCYTKLNTTSLPLLAILRGNDYVDSSKFAGGILKAAKYEQQTTHHHSQIYQILSWLESQGKGDEALNLIKDAINSICNSKDQKLIENCLNNYVTPCSADTLSLSDYFTQLDSVHKQQPFCHVRDYSGRPLPDWFIRSLHCSQITVVLFNISISRRIFLLCQAENIKERSAYKISQPIREVLYAIILQRKSTSLCHTAITQDSAACNDNLSSSSDSDASNEDVENDDESELSHQMDRQNKNLSSDDELSDDDYDGSEPVITDWQVPQRSCGTRQLVITEFDRVKDDLKKNVIAINEIFCRDDLPCLDDIPLLTDKKKFELMKGILCPENTISADDCMFSPHVELIIYLTVFWIQRANPPVTKNHLNSILVGILFMHFKSYKENLSSRPSSYEKSSEFYTALTDSSEKQLKLLLGNLEKYTNDCSAVMVLDVKILHAFSQFQSCLFCLMHLNKLLQIPHTFFDPRIFFHGTFLYNFCCDLATRKNVDLFIHEMLVKDSPLAVLYDKMYAAIIIHCGEDCFLESQSKAKNLRVSSKWKQCSLPKKKKANLKKKSGKAQKRNKHRKNIVTVNVSNRFSALKLD